MATSPPTPRQAARKLRADFVAGLLPAEKRQLEKAMADHLILPTPPGIMGSYRALGPEIDPWAIEEKARLAGWKIAYPRVQGAAPLTFHQCTPEQLTLGFKGISEPPQEAPIVFPDTLLAPLVLADLQGNRMGQGGGHYDRTLAQLRERLMERGPLQAIGLAWDIQIVPHLQPEPWDAPLDAIATPSGFHLTPSGARASA